MTKPTGRPGRPLEALIRLRIGAVWSELQCPHYGIQAPKAGEWRTKALKRLPICTECAFTCYAYLTVGLLKHCMSEKVPRVGIKHFLMPWLSYSFLHSPQVMRQKIPSYLWTAIYCQTYFFLKLSLSVLMESKPHTSFNSIMRTQALWTQI